MNHRAIISACCVLCLFLAGAASASAQGGPPAIGPEDRFALLDRDGNGKLTWEEFSAVNTGISRQGFDMMDKNHDGNLSMEEWLVFSSNHGMSVTTSETQAIPAKELGMPLVMPPREPGITTPKNAAPRSPQAPVAGSPADPGKPEAGTEGVPLVRPPKAPDGSRVPGGSGSESRSPRVPLVTPPKAPTAGKPSMPAPSGGMKTE